MSFLLQLEDFDPHSLGLLQRIFLVSDGTLTDTLEAAFLEPVGIVKLAAETAREPVPLHLRNAVTPLMKNLQYGQGYRYVHNDPSAAEEMKCLPERLQGRKYYQPNGPEDNANEG